MDEWLSLGVKGAATWPDKETPVTFGGHELLLKPATRATEPSIHIKLRRITAVDAMTLANRFLSILAWCSNTSMENLYGWAGNAVPVAVPRATRTVGSTGGLPFPFHRDLEQNPKARLALALFREGLTVNSVPFSLLSYFKILNMFWTDRKDKTGKNRLVEGLRATLPKVTDSAAIRRIEALRKAGEDVPAYLYQSGRCAIAHAYAKPIVDPDDVSDIRRLSEDLDIVKAVAEHLMRTELSLSRSLY